MVEAKRKIFVVIGKDSLSRSQATENIKKKILQNKTFQLNAIIFYSKEIDLNNLRSDLLTFSFDQEKVLVFKDAYSLPAAVKDFMANNFKKIISSNYVIFEIDKDFYFLSRDKKFKEDPFFNYLFQKGTIFKVSSCQEPCTFEAFKGSIRKFDYPSCIYILEKLFERDPKAKYLGPKILGIITQEFSYLRNPVERKKCFPYLLEADRAVKEKGLDSRLAIEVLLAKLFAQRHPG